MILEKLMEKKDLLAYLVARVTVLKLEQKKAAKIKNVLKREVAIRQIQGRVSECQYLRKLTEQNTVKSMSKEYWKRAAIRTVWRQEKK